MTKKDYIKFADAFRETKEQIDSCHGIELNEEWTALDVWTKLRNEISTIFAYDNPRFNHELFEEACEK